MVFYLIGLGLGDVTDITVKGLEIVRLCKKVYFENYTSLLSFGFDQTQLEKFYGRPIIEADREMVEQGIDQILQDAYIDDIALLVVDLMVRAKKIDVPVKIHNASILTAVGCTGLQLYHFGATVSIPFWTDNWEPDSFLDRARKEYEQPRFLTCSQAARQIITAIDKNKDREDIRLHADMYVVAMARIGWDDQKIVYATLRQIAFDVDMGLPLHSLIIPAFELHPLEKEMLEFYIFK